MPGPDIDSTFAYYAFIAVNEEMQILGSGTTFKEISANSFCNMKIPYFSLDKQHAIVRYLDAKCAAIDEAIERHKKIIEKLEEYRKNGITYMATKGLGGKEMKDSGSGWYGQIPCDWNVKRFKYVASVKSNLVEPEPYMDLPQIGPDLIEKKTLDVSSESELLRSLEL